jgi:hypothetical protein
VEDYGATSSINEPEIAKETSLEVPRPAHDGRIHYDVQDYRINQYRFKSGPFAQASRGYDADKKACGEVEGELSLVIQPVRLEDAKVL